MKKMLKTIAALSFALIIFCTFTIPASAISPYNPSAALLYASSHWNDGKGLCAEFVSDCLKAGGCKGVWTRGVTSMVKLLKNSNYGTWTQLTVERNGCISISKNSGRISPGDPIFFYCPKETDGAPYVHVVLYGGQDSNGYMKVYSHNNAMNNATVDTRYCGYCNAKTISAVYAYHLGDSTPHLEPSYFECNMQIDCIKGKTVNLYSSLYDTSRVDYFNQGQTAYSTYGAKLDDGSIWYQITATDGRGVVYKYWLKYDSSQMVIKDLSKSDPTNIKFSVSSLSLDLEQNQSQTISLSVMGDLPKKGALLVDWSDASIASIDFGGKRTGRESSPTIKAKSVGQATLTCSIIDLNNRKTLASASVKVKVTAPEYTIKYDANGGTGAPPSQIKKYQVPLTLSSQKPTRSGYTFVGWASADNVSTVFSAGDTFVHDHNVTLYAIWELVQPTYSYFYCDVQIDCVNGKTINLYRNLYDSSRADYFDKGQTAYSTLGASLADGSIWYQIKVVSNANGSVCEYWLKYDSSKMSIHDRAMPQPEPEPEPEPAPEPTPAPISMQFNISSLSLDLKTKGSQSVTLTVTGDLPEHPGLVSSIGDRNIVSVDWGSSHVGKVSYPVIIAKATGSTTFTCDVIDKDSGKKLASASISIVVTAPQYTIRYDANGGSGAPSSQIKKYQVPLTISGKVPTRSGYTFAGWMTSPNGSYCQYSSGDSYTLDKNITLYALWNKVEYPQYFSCNVQINCVKGQTVNLYNNLYDSRRADYFDLGQTAYSSYGAKLEDGSIWYRIKARSSVDGAVHDYWLKYESWKMTIS